MRMGERKRVMRLRKIMSLLLIGAMTLSLVACGGDKNEDNAAKVQSRKDNNELIVAIGEEPETGFDSTTGGHGSITKLVFSTLFRRDKELGWEGDLATGYEVSEDRLTWTVTIRDDAMFTDGTKVLAEDVAYTYNEAKVSGADIDLTIIDSVEAIDDTTVAFHLTRVYSPFIESMAYLGIVPKHAHDESFKDEPIGSGPYKLIQWDKGQQMIFQANEDYYGDKASINKLTLAFLSTDAAYAAVENGTIDVAQITGTLANNEVEGTKIIDIPSIECYGVCFPMIPDEGKNAKDGARMGNNVTCDLAIRQALNAAVDRKQIVESVMGGYGSVSTTGLEKMPWLNEDTVLAEDEYGNVDLARDILSKGGWKDTDNDGIVEKNGIKASFKLLYTEGKYRQEMAMELVKVAAEIGIEIELVLKTWDTILDEIHKEAVLYGFGSGDPSELYNLYYGGIAGGEVAWDNSGVYSNEEADACIDKALEAKDEEEALSYWKELQNYTSAKGDAPYCWLANANHVYIAAEGFSFGTPVVQPHGGRIFDNVNEWHWEK